MTPGEDLREPADDHDDGDAGEVVDEAPGGTAVRRGTPRRSARAARWIPADLERTSEAYRALGMVLTYDPHSRSDLPAGRAD